MEPCPFMLLCAHGNDLDPPRASARAISAVDVALWDILGQHTGQPISVLLGGRARDRVPVYNTCVSHGRYQDFHAWREGRAGELAQDLLREGITAMKIWPFDQFGASLGGPIGSGPGPRQSVP